jgi:hypothetical protein
MEANEYTKLYNLFIYDDSYNKLKTYDEIKNTTNITKKEYENYKETFYKNIDNNNIIIQYYIKLYLELQRQNHTCMTMYRDSALKIYGNNSNLIMPQNPCELKWCNQNICKNQNSQNSTLLSGSSLLSS